MKAFLVERSIGDVLTAMVRGIASHPEDDLILATAFRHQLIFFYQRKMLLKLGSYSGVTILSPGSFQAMLDGMP